MNAAISSWRACTNSNRSPARFSAPSSAVDAVARVAVDPPHAPRRQALEQEIRHRLGHLQSFRSRAQRPPRAPGWAARGAIPGVPACAAAARSVCQDDKRRRGAPVDTRASGYAAEVYRDDRHRGAAADRGMPREERSSLHEPRHSTPHRRTRATSTPRRTVKTTCPPRCGSDASARASRAPSSSSCAGRWASGASAEAPSVYPRTIRARRTSAATATASTTTRRCAGEPARRAIQRRHGPQRRLRPFTPGRRDAVSSGARRVSRRR